MDTIVKSQENIVKSQKNIMNSQKEPGYKIDKLLATYKIMADEFDEQRKDSQRRWLELIKKGNICSKCEEMD